MKCRSKLYDLQKGKQQQRKVVLIIILSIANTTQLHSAAHGPKEQDFTLIFCTESIDDLLNAFSPSSLSARYWSKIAT